ncbi:Uncharacterised protein [Mycobacteroides abscessus subsp. abscessus]|nr:Uncharacterised protein [Mycobacteroides abscessus subsp. abscessus]
MVLGSGVLSGQSLAIRSGRSGLAMNGRPKAIKSAQPASMARTARSAVYLPASRMVPLKFSRTATRKLSGISGALSQSASANDTYAMPTSSRIFTASM